MKSREITEERLQHCLNLLAEIMTERWEADRSLAFEPILHRLENELAAMETTPPAIERALRYLNKSA